jgi:MSHA biogenesis protein MshN
MALVGDAAMSLINQMLQDLEKRRPQGAIGDVLPAQIIAVTPHHSLYFSGWKFLLITALLGVGAAASVQLLQPSAAAISTHAVPRSTPTTPVPLAPAASSLPANAMPSDATLDPKVNIASIAPILPSISDSPAPSIPSPQPVQPATAVPLPVTATAVPQSPPQVIDTPDQGRQNTLQAPRLHIAGNAVSSTAPAIPDATISSKQLKEITPAQQAENEYRAALESVQMGRMARAIESLTQALRLDASHSAARQTIAGLLVDAQRFDEAERHLQEGLKLDPSQPGLAMMLARLQVERGDVHAGLETLQRTLPDAMAQTLYISEQANYQAFMAALLQREGRHAEAIEHYLQALRNAPGSGVWLMGIGISLQAEKRLAEAQEAFKRAKASNTLTPDLQAFVEQRLRQIKQQS